MTYPKQLTNAAELVLAPFLPKLKGLGEGKSFVLEDAPEAIDTLRYYIYSWLHLNSLKELYILRRETPKQLRILRRTIPDPKLVSMELTSAVEEFVKSELLEAETKEEAAEIIQQGVLGGRLSPDHIDGAMAEWRRINAL